MKTTFDIASSILNRSRQLAKRERLPLKELVEEGLELVIERRESMRAGKKVEPVTFKGEGLSKEFAGGSWQDIRDAAYQGRGA